MSIKSQLGYAICDFLYCQIHCRDLMFLCISICIISSARVLCPYHNEIRFLNHAVISNCDRCFEMRSLGFGINADIIIIGYIGFFVFKQFFGRIWKYKRMNTSFTTNTACRRWTTEDASRSNSPFRPTRTVRCACDAASSDSLFSRYRSMVRPFVPSHL